MSHPTMTEAEARNHATFTALMWALSYPGRSQQLPVGGMAALAAIGWALLDLETSYYTPNTELDALLARTGARRSPASEARYQLFPTLAPADLEALATAPVGTYAYPDESATLVLGCAFGQGLRLRLSGPGIPQRAELRVAGLSHELWRLRAEMVRYPLGWDLLLVAGDQVVGLPRTTVVEIA